MASDSKPVSSIPLVWIRIGVDEHIRRPQHVLPDGGALLIGERALLQTVQRVGHQFQPALGGGDPDGEMGMPHAQPRMPPLLGVVLRAAPVLDQEHPQTRLRALPVIRGIHRPEDVIGAHLFIEAVNNEVEGLLATHAVVEVLRACHIPKSRPGPRGRCNAMR